MLVGAGAAAGVVSCRIEKIDYGTLDLVLQILGLDIVKDFLSGGMEVLLEALSGYAVEAFSLTFPGTENEVVAVASATPGLIATFQRSAQLPASTTVSA